MTTLGAGSARRGQPLVMLIAVLGMWTAARAALWDGAGLLAVSDLPAQGSSGGTQLVAAEQVLNQAGGALTFLARPTTRVQLRDPPPAPFEPEVPPGLLADLLIAPRRLLAAAAAVRMTKRGGEPPVEVAAYVARAPVLQIEPVPPAAFGAAPMAPRGSALSTTRWSADAWLLMRAAKSGGTASGAPVLSYGASQVGAVLRYRLGAGTQARAVYLRATAALASPRSPRLAAGLAIRPVAALPLTAMAEVRVDLDGAYGVHPALIAVTALPPIALPLGVRAEAYAQAGYVAGGADATAFVDGQLRADRLIAQLGANELRVGGGLWGGAQKGAGRLDVGPGATLVLPHVAGGARLSLDWRFRVAGDAVPHSGTALTLSTGF